MRSTQPSSFLEQVEALPRIRLGTKQYVRLDDLLSIEPKQGEWLPIPYEIDNEFDGQCSRCKEKIIDGTTYNFCPMCGAKMEVDKGGK